MKKLPYLPSKFPKIFNDAIGRAIIREMAADGLVVYFNLAEEDLAKLTGLQEIETRGDYVSGFYIGEYDHEVCHEEVKVKLPGGPISIPYSSIVVYGHANDVRYVQVLDGPGVKPEGYDQLMGRNPEEKLPDNVVMFSAPKTIQ